jgi:hypothetical protein
MAGALTIGPSVVKPLGITVKKAVETKVDAEKLNNMYYGRVMMCSNSPAMDRLDLWTQCS